MNEIREVQKGNSYKSPGVIRCDVHDKSNSASVANVSEFVKRLYRK